MNTCETTMHILYKPVSHKLKLTQVHTSSRVNIKCVPGYESIYPGLSSAQARLPNPLCRFSVHVSSVQPVVALARTAQTV